MHTNGRRNLGFEADDDVENRKNVYVELGENEASLTSKNTEYNPDEHRQVQHPTTYLETLIHLLKGSLGTGILAMPNGFKNAGYLAGAIGAALIGAICTYCVHQLVKAELILCFRKKLPSLNYRDVIEKAFEEGPAFFRTFVPYIGAIVDTFLLICTLGCSSVYVVFVASNIKSIADYYMESSLDLRIYMLIILLPLILINWIRNLKYFAPFSTFANVAVLTSIVIIFYYIFRAPFNIENKVAVGTPKGLTLFFGTAVFALEGIPIILPLKNEMKKPSQFGGSCGVLNVTMVLIVFLFASMGLFGYLSYGNDTKGSITLNLPSKDILAQSVQGMMTFAVFISYGLSVYVSFDIIWNGYVAKRLHSQGKQFVWEYVIRTAVVLFTFLLAIALPSLEIFMSLFGAFSIATLGLMFPPIIQICIEWYDVKGVQKAWLLIKNVMLMGFGLLGLVVGTYISLSEIVRTFS